MWRWNGVVIDSQLRERERERIIRGKDLYEEFWGLSAIFMSDQ